MTDPASAANLLRTLHDLQLALQATQSALVELEEDLLRQSSSRPGEQQQERSLELLSTSEVSKELGMGKSWVYRRLKSGEIPSAKVGNNIKVKRSDLERYLERQRYQSPQ